MIRTFKNKELQKLWAGKPNKIDHAMHARILRRLEALEVATEPGDMALPGFDFHPLRGFKPTRYSVHVNGPWTITFEFEDADAHRVDFEQYH
jgi:proteic killer suppression protein